MHVLVCVVRPTAQPLVEELSATVHQQLMLLVHFSQIASLCSYQTDTTVQAGYWRFNVDFFFQFLFMNYHAIV